MNQAEKYHQFINKYVNNQKNLDTINLNWEQSTENSKSVKMRNRSNFEEVDITISNDDLDYAIKDILNSGDVEQIVVNKIKKRLHEMEFSAVYHIYNTLTGI
jgi:hypothetical protein